MADILTKQKDYFNAKATLQSVIKNTKDKAIKDEASKKLEQVKGENESLAGLMLELFSRIPRTGAETTLNIYRFFIEAADSKKVKTVKVHVAPEKFLS